MPETSAADALMRQAYPLHEAGDFAAAEPLYRQILAIDPDYADAHFLLGQIELSRGLPAQAVSHLGAAVRCRSGEAAFQETLADAHMALGAWGEAAAAFVAALRLQPRNAPAWNKLGIVRTEQRDFVEAGRCFGEALAVDPTFLPALNNHASACRDTGRNDEALAGFRKLKDLAPGDPVVYSNYLFQLNLTSGATREEIFAEHCEYDRRFGSGRGAPAPRGMASNRDPDRRLRIAYFSPDLRSHPVNAFISPVLAHHDRARFEVSCYYLYPREDDFSRRLKGLSDRWVACAGDSDAALAERIRGDGIDLLVDLAGHTGWNRLPVLALKPAPVIATWLGYLNTTGLRAVDYRITDAFSDPPGSERFHTETLVRLPEGHSCFEQLDIPTPVNPLPALTRGQVRFGSFNRASKLTETVLVMWASILEATPGSSLMIVGVEGDMVERVRSVLRGRGVAADRVECRGRMTLDRMLAVHREVDIALDTHPYAGTTTTFNSLWMGVPTVTLAGDRPVSRSCGSVMTALGLGDWVATTVDEYVTIAAGKAADLAGLARLRHELRGRLLRSSLMDAERFTRQLEAAYRDMWRAYCAATVS